MSAWTKIKKKLKSGTWYPFYNTFYEKTRIDPYTILLESRSGRGMESNIFAILRELNQEEYRKYSIVFACRSDYKASVEKKLQHYGLKVDKLMKFGSISYYRMLSRAKYLINDSTFPGRFIKKDGQIYLNVWHGTPLKCMGSGGALQHGKCYAKSSDVRLPAFFQCVYGGKNAGSLHAG